MNIDDPGVRAAVFGEQVRIWLESDIGKFIIGKAEDQRDEAIDQLKTVSPWRRRRIQYLQNRVVLAESIQQWMADAIIEGEEAMRLLDDE